MVATAKSLSVESASSQPAATAHLDTFAHDNLPPRAQWPEMIFTRSELQYPARINCVAHFLDRWVAQGRGDAPCIVSPTVSYSYRELQALVNRIANVLVKDLGLVTGGRVLLRSANNPMMVATYLAVLKTGGVVVATMRGWFPRRKPNSRLSQASTGYFHLAGSSAQAASCCGPRNWSGSSPE